MRSVLWVKHCLAQWYLVTQRWVEAPLLEKRSLGTWRARVWYLGWTGGKASK